MNTHEEEPTAAHKPEESDPGKTSLPRTLLSLIAFVAVYYWLFQDWLQTAALVGTLLIHESGHFIAMKYFGYRAVNMTFIPFVGAYVSGTASNLSRRNKLIVLLAGPLPGMLIGMALLGMHQFTGILLYYSLAMPMLLLNGLNLLPVYPLDGGQFFQVLLFRGSRFLQLGFLYLSAAVLVWLFFRLHYNWVLLVVAGLVLVRIRYLHFIGKVRRQLDVEGLDYACSYDDLSDEEYRQIRNALIRNSAALRRSYQEEQPSEKEADLIRYVESVLVPPYSDTLSVREQVFFALIWLLAWALPAFCWWYLYIQHGIR